MGVQDVELQASIHNFVGSRHRQCTEIHVHEGHGPKVRVARRNLAKPNIEAGG